MAATVLSFPSPMPDPSPCVCPRCDLDDLAGRVRSLLDRHDGELLIPREHLDEVLRDLTDTTDRLLPPSETTRPERTSDQ